MTLKSEFELANTRQKLRELEEHYEARRGETAANPHARELTLRSLKRLINQLKEEIAVFEAHRLARR